MRKPPLQDVIVKPSSRQFRGNGAPERMPHETPEYGVGGVTRLPDRTNGVRRDEQQSGFEAVEPGLRTAGVRSAVSPLRRRGGFRERRWLIVALGIGAIIVLSSVVLSLLFAGATVTVYPKQDTPVVSASFKVQVNGEGGTLPFERMVLDRTEQDIVVATGEQQVEDRASGTITIYNEYSTTPQRLIKNTRFQSSSGKIYRIRESVEVPGKKNSTPGSIDVTVFAEEPGDTYNMGPDTFQIPGFVGLPQEGKVYGRSTGDMTGGFVGVTRSVDEQDRARTLAALESKLRDELLAAAFGSSDKPEGYILFKEAVFFEFNPLPDESAEADKVVLKLSGKLHGILLPESQFAQRLAQLTISSYDGSPIRLDNPYDLTVTVQPVTEGDAAGQTIAAWDAVAYNVNVQGKAHFIWEFNATNLARDLAGKEKSILDTPQDSGIRQAYPGIDNLTASIRPFWKHTFPDKPEDIVVVTELDS
jgi:hypothetical protein